MKRTASGKNHRIGITLAQLFETFRRKAMTRRCKDCRKWFGVRAGTCMESSRLGLQAWVTAVYLPNTGLEGQASMKRLRRRGLAA